MNVYLYYTGSSILCIALILSLFEKIGNKRNTLFSHNTAYLVVICILLIINKMCFLKAGMINEDESLMLVGGRTLGQDFRPWVSVDPTTSGPFNLLPALFLLKVYEGASYGALRLLYVVAFQVSTIVLLFNVVNRTRGGLTARLAITPLVLCFTFLFHQDHTHASSEQFPLLLSAIYLATIILIMEEKAKAGHIIICGVACVAGVFVKLQIAPISMLAFMVCGTLLVASKKSWKYAAWLFAGALITATSFLLFIYSYGGFQDFIQSYIYSNLKYTSVQPSRKAVSMFIDYNTDALLPLLGFFPFVVVWSAKDIILNTKKREFARLGILLLMLVVAVYCAIKPGRFFVHYGMLLIIPLYGCFLWLELYSKASDKKMTPYFIAIIAILFFFNTRTAPKILKSQGSYRLSSTRIEKTLKRDAHANERMAAWGWATPYLQEFRLLLGTRDVHSDFQVSYTGPMGAYYRARFLADLKENRPEWFLDISGPGQFGGSEVNRLENFPAIHDFVIRNYTVVLNDTTAVLYRYKNR